MNPVLSSSSSSGSRQFNLNGTFKLLRQESNHPTFFQTRLLEIRACENLKGTDSHPALGSSSHVEWTERCDPLHSNIPNGCKNSEKNLVDDRVLDRGSSSLGPSLEPTPTRSFDLVKHNVTHFPKDRNFEICQRTNVTRAPCRRHIGGAVPHAENFGDLITAGHKILSAGCESRNNHRNAIVVQDLAAQWIQSYPCKNKETCKSSWSPMRSLKSFVLIIPWNLAQGRFMFFARTPFCILHHFCPPLLRNTPWTPSYFLTHFCRNFNRQLRSVAPFTEFISLTGHEPQLFDDFHNSEIAGIIFEDEIERLRRSTFVLVWRGSRRWDHQESALFTTVHSGASRTSGPKTSSSLSGRKFVASSDCLSCKNGEDPCSELVR